MTSTQNYIPKDKRKAQKFGLLNNIENEEINIIKENIKLVKKKVKPEKQIKKGGKK